MSQTSLNQRIINRIKTNLSLINGIKKVFEWLSRPLGDKEFPALILRDPDDHVADDSLGVTEAHALKLEIDIVVSPDEMEATKVRELIPFVKKAVGNAITSDDFYYHGSYRGRTIIGEHKDYFYVSSRLTFIIDFETEKTKLLTLNLDLQKQVDELTTKTKSKSKTYSKPEDKYQEGIED